MRLPPLALRPGDRDELELGSRCSTVEARVAERARLVLMAADGASNREIGAAIGMHYNQVAVWRRRYATSVWPDWSTGNGRAPTGVRP